MPSTQAPRTFCARRTNEGLSTLAPLSSCFLLALLYFSSDSTSRPHSSKMCTYTLISLSSHQSIHFPIAPSTAFPCPSLNPHMTISVSSLPTLLVPSCRAGPGATKYPTSLLFMGRKEKGFDDIFSLKKFPSFY